jgi:serine/threonine-protein kinase
MGAVYLAVERGTTAPLYAIKRAHPHLLEEPEFRKMFLAEARLASKIRHPNAVGVIAIDESDGELQLVMEYLAGGSLGDLLAEAYAARRRVPAPVALRVVIDAARGLHAAHELRGEDGKPLGLIHRDVSPQNILVGRSGRAAIVDFGVAKAVALGTTRTASDVLKGKAAYMAPEYLWKRISTPSSDVFSLGVVCWEAIANRRLFKGDDEVDTMQRIRSSEPAPMLTDVASVDANVAAIVARALCKDPAKRFPTAEALADALESRARNADMLATPSEVSACVESLLAEALAERDQLVAEALGFADWATLSARGADVALAKAPERTITVPNAAPAPSAPAPAPVAPARVGRSTDPMRALHAPTLPLLPVVQAPKPALRETVRMDALVAAPTFVAHISAPPPAASPKRRSAAAAWIAAGAVVLGGIVAATFALRGSAPGEASNAVEPATTTAAREAQKGEAEPASAATTAEPTPSAAPSAAATAEASSSAATAPPGGPTPSAAAPATARPNTTQQPQRPAGGTASPASSAWRPKTNPYD